MINKTKEQVTKDLTVNLLTSISKGRWGAVRGKNEDLIVFYFYK